MGNTCLRKTLEEVEQAMVTPPPLPPKKEEEQPAVPLETAPVHVVAEQTMEPVVVEHVVEQKLDLMAVDPNSVDDIPHRNQLIDARVFKVYDGDTCSIIFAVGASVMKTSIRVMGVDCPEIRPKDPSQSAELKKLEKEAGAKCRDFVASQILEKVVKVKLLDNDKYGGRMLGEIYIMLDGSEVSLTSALIDRGYAKPYKGEKKTPWTKEELTRPPFA